MTTVPYSELEHEFKTIKAAVDHACEEYYRAKFRGDPNAEIIGDRFDALDLELERLGDALAAHPGRPRTWIPLW